jgi:hypothetical protein
MPRVNRDLQRRMAARRERERRRPPTERRYRFASPDAVESAPEADEEELLDGAPEMLPARATARATPTRRAAEATPRPAGGRFAPKPFSAYREEYAYVVGDLRRIVAVVGSILVILIVLHFVLPR